jgi:hypothetical protein
MMTTNKTNFVDFRGNPLPNHDGKSLLVNEDEWLSILRRGWSRVFTRRRCYRSSRRRKQFFLSDGTAIIHDGSPIDLPDGTVQYFDHDGRAMWPVDDKNLAPLINQQRTEFFKAMIAKIGKVTPLTDGETEDLRLALLAAEHPDSEENKNLVWHEDVHRTKVKPICVETSGTLINSKFSGIAYGPSINSSQRDACFAFCFARTKEIRKLRSRSTRSFGIHARQ